MREDIESLIRSTKPLTSRAPQVSLADVEKATVLSYEYMFSSKVRIHVNTCEFTFAFAFTPCPTRSRSKTVSRPKLVAPNEACGLVRNGLCGFVLHNHRLSMLLEQVMACGALSKDSRPEQRQRLV
eukprot:1176444-Prorocentrum_minimum.AAC.1